MPIKTKFTRSPLLISLLRGTAIALGLQLSGIAISYIMQVLLARWMGATQYGVYDYALGIGTFLGFLACLGLPNSLLRFIPEYTVKEDWGKLRGIVWGSWRYVFASSVALSSIGILILINWHRYNPEVALVSLFIGDKYNSSLGINQTSTGNGKRNSAHGFSLFTINGNVSFTSHCWCILL